MVQKQLKQSYRLCTQVQGTLLHVTKSAVKIPSALYTDTKGGAKAFCLIFHKSAS